MANFLPTLGEFRLIIDAIDSVQRGYPCGVPLCEFTEHPGFLPARSERRGEEAGMAYHAENDRVSMDGLPTGTAS